MTLFLKYLGLGFDSRHLHQLLNIREDYLYENYKTKTKQNYQRRN